MKSSTRRKFIKGSVKLGAGLLLWPTTSWSAPPTPDPLEQKIGRLFTLNMYWRTPPDFFLKTVEKYHLGGAYLDKNSLVGRDTAKRAVDKLNSAAQKPLIIVTDCEGGAVNRMRKIQGFPTAGSLGDSYAGGEYDAEALFSKIMARVKLVKELGLNFNFDPVLDLRGPYIGARSYGKDPAKVAEAARIILRAYREAGVNAVAKHFPGLGRISSNPHHQVLPSVSCGLDELLKSDLIPFKAAVNERVSSVMVTHLKVTALDKKMPASLSPAIINGLLRRDLGFNGVVWPDSLTMGAITKLYKGQSIRDIRVISRASVDAIKAGVDQIFNFHLDAAKFPQVVAKVKAAVKSGELTEDRLDQSIARIQMLNLES
jgi:beta-N-acetylhexosaminidase